MEVRKFYDHSRVNKLNGKPFMFIPTAKDVWDAIRETCSDLENSSQIFELKTKLWQLKQRDRDVTEYYNGILTLWQELDLCYDDQWDCTSDKTREERKMTEHMFFLLDLTKNGRGQGTNSWEETLAKYS